MVNQLVFNEDKHQYSVNGLVLPSVTNIMKPLTTELYRSIDEAVLEKAAKRGSSVHYATELFDLYGAEEIELENRGYLEAYKKFKKDYQVEVIEVEKQLFHPTLYFAGTLDRIVKINGKRVLLDIKTTEKIHKELVSIQVSAYQEMASKNGIEVDELAVLKLNKNGTYEFVYLNNNLDMFMYLYKIYMFKKRFIN